MSSYELQCRSGLAVPRPGPFRDFQAFRASARAGQSVCLEVREKGHGHKFANTNTHIHKTRKNLFAANVT